MKIYDSSVNNSDHTTPSLPLSGTSRKPRRAGESAGLSRSGAGKLQPSDFDPLLESCPVCFSSSIQKKKTDYTGIDIFQCRNCRIEFMNPQYTDNYLEEFYAGYYKNDTSHHYYKDNTAARSLIHRENLAEIEQYKKPGRFLSVGTGNGLDLIEARNNGWEVEGYDYDAAAVQDVAENHHLKVKSGLFTAIDYPDSYFDCIYVNHVLEHPKNPGGYLRMVSRIIKPGGVLFIACPNICSFSARLKNFLEFIRLKKSRAKHYDTWQHLIYYSPLRLKRILQKQYGFKVMKYGNCVEINMKTGKPVRGAIPVAYKSTFRLIALKNTHE